MKAGGGLITKADLAAYKANERKPIHAALIGVMVSLMSIALLTLLTWAALQGLASFR